MGRNRDRKARQRNDSRRPPEPVRLSGHARWLSWALPVVVTIAAFTAFWPALDAEFVNYDDDRLLVSNRSYRGFGGDQLSWMFSTTFMGHYQPLTWLSWALDDRLSAHDPNTGEPDPFVFHLNNVILNALNALLLYFVALRLLRAALRLGPFDGPIAARCAAATAALLFAVHPLRVESVAWATERRDVLSVFLLLAAALAYLRAFPAGEAGIKSRPWYLASIGLLILSLLAKSWGMSFFVWMIVLDAFPLRRLPAKPAQWRQAAVVWVLVQKIPYLVCGVWAAVQAGRAQRSALDTMLGLDQWGIVERVVQACYGLAFYVRKTVWPTRLAALYELPYRLNPAEWRYVASIAAVVVAAVVVWLLRRRLPGVMAAAVLYVVILAPVLGIAQSGPQLVADKYSYVSCIGWAVLAGGGLLVFWRRRPTPAGWIAGGAAACAVIAALFAATWRQTRVWHDSRSLWEHALSVGAASSIAHMSYATILRSDGRIDDAIKHYHTAVAIRPDAGDAWFNLANALKAAGRYDEAERAYLEAVKYMTQRNSAHLNLGNMYYNNLGRVDDAVAQYRLAIDYGERFRDKMFSSRPYLALGIALARKGETDEARVHLLLAARYKETAERAQVELRKLDAKR